MFFFKDSHKTLTSFRVVSPMEYTPDLGGFEKRITMSHSGSEDIGPDSHNFPLTEYRTLKNATKIWEGQRHPAYNSKSARLRSYTNWPRGMNPSPDPLSRAGFYFSGKYHIIIILVLHFLKKQHSLRSCITGRSDITHWFHFGLTLHEWRSTNNPFREHATWSQLCVYVRYMKGEAFVRDCQKSRCTLV